MRHNPAKLSFGVVSMLAGALLASPTQAQAQAPDKDLEILAACLQLVKSGPLKIAEDRTERFLGKVQEQTARCRGGDRAVARRGVPWVDWSNYWGAGDAASKAGSEDRIRVLPRSAPSARPQHARHRRRADGSRIPAHGADQVQPVRQRDLRDTTSPARKVDGTAGRRLGA